MNSKLLLFVISGLIVVSYFSNDVVAEEHSVTDSSISWSEGKIKWLETSYSSTGTGVVQIIDLDMDLNSKEIDNFDVDVWSDTDFAGIDLTITETGDATGIFEGTVYFTSTDDTSGHRLRVSQGDTIFSKYDDITVPKTDTNDKLVLIGMTTIQGSSVSMIEDRITLDKESYLWDNVVFITIVAPELNQDTKSIEKIDDPEKFPIEITTRHFEIKEFNLVETGVDTDIFSGKITLKSNEFTNADYSDNDGISVNFEYEEDKVAIGSAPIVLNPKSLDSTDERCGVGTVSVDGVCQVVKVEKIKTVGDDAPFFGIFVYFEELFSWIMQSSKQTVSEKDYVATFDFEGDDLGNYEKWCLENNGDWIKDYDCGFENPKNHKQARDSLRTLTDVYVEGKPAKDACEFLELRGCDRISSLPAKFDMRTGQYTFKHFVGYKDFEVRVNGDGIQYRPNSIEGQDESSWIDYGPVQRTLVPDEENLAAELLIYDLKDSQALRTYEFQIGKFSNDVDRDSVIEFCGRFNEETKNQYFKGVVKDNTLSDFGLERHLPTSCLISDEAKWWKIIED